MPVSVPQQYIPALPSAAPLRLTVPAVPARQPRATVLLRYLLALPHMVVLGLLGAVAGPVTAVAWITAVITGRVPGWAYQYSAGLWRWQARAAGYTWLLTPVYPPFGLDGDDSGYPVRADIPAGCRMNRGGILFRVLLAVPALVANTVVVLGAGAVMPVAWLITLAAGRMPVCLHQGLAAVLRWQLRVAAYTWLLVRVYPGGMLGDPPESGDPARLVLTPGARGIVHVMLAIGALIMLIFLAGILTAGLVLALHQAAAPVPAG